MALKDLVADRGKITEEQIEKIVAKYVRYDPKTIEVIFTPESAKLNNDAKILLYLVAVTGWEFIADEQPNIRTNPQALEEILGIPGGTLRPILKRLKESHLVNVSNSNYSIRPANLEAIGKIIDGEEKVVKKSKPSTAKAKTSSPKPDKEKSTESSKAKRKSGTPIRASLDGLLHDGFFQEHKTLKQVVGRLHEQAIIAKSTSLSGPMADLVRDQKLERKKVEEAGQQVWAYKTK